MQSVQPLHRDITLRSNTHLIINFALKNADQSEAQDLTGYEAFMQVKESASSATVLIDLSTDNSKIAIDGPNGTVTVTVTPADIAAFTIKRGVYDLILVSDSGVRYPIYEGAVDKVLGVTTVV